MIKFAITATTVPAVATLFANIPIAKQDSGVADGAKRLTVQLQAAVAALTGFEIRARAHDGADFDTLYSTAGDYNTPRGLLIGTSGNLAALAAGARGWFIMDVTGLDTVQLWATSGGTATLAAQGRAE